MKVMVLGLDGATWDVLEPLIQEGLLPNLARLREQGSWGKLELGVPAAESGGLDGGDDRARTRGSTASSSSWSTATTRWAGG